ncbi:MAG TPA: hypothetical protein VK427_16895 [Kofleriaceae bacterium]|nr:hypothetical protein [Kofleriaceae bacterium]
MLNRITTIALLLGPAFAAAEETPAPLPTAAVETPRRLSVAVAVGAAALPSTNLSIVVAQGGINFAAGRNDYRLSGVLYSTTGDNDSSGFGVAAEQRWNLHRSYGVGIGALLASHTIDRGDDGSEGTAMVGLLLSPAVFRVGERQRWELAVTGFVMRELAYDTLTPGFYVSAGYCAR